MPNPTRCDECNRILTNSESKKQGRGPVCAAKKASDSGGNALMGLDL